ncbi:hypothetical protein DDE05_40210 [Streptomyces cavourensis]|nr:hypothetical protein DDE05_40210 [Streptomyces cavourensis]
MLIQVLTPNLFRLTSFFFGDPGYHHMLHDQVVEMLARRLLCRVREPCISQFFRQQRHAPGQLVGRYDHLFPEIPSGTVALPIAMVLAFGGRLLHALHQLPGGLAQRIPLIFQRLNLLQKFAGLFLAERCHRFRAIATRV